MPTIAETTRRNFDAISVNTMTAFDMALRSHNLSEDGKYARETNGNLWIWSDRREAWVQIDNDRIF
jgi:hypothetical protein